MALITCPECGRQISDRASVCIGCGIPMEEIIRMLNAKEKPVQTNVMDRQVRCLYCGKHYNASELKCPNCYYPTLSFTRKVAEPCKNHGSNNIEPHQNKKQTDLSFLMPIEDQFEIAGRGTVVTGRIERGILKSGSLVDIVGLDKTRKNVVVVGIESNRKIIDQAGQGQSVGVLLRGIRESEIERGQVIAKPGTVHAHTKFKSQIYVLKKEEGGRYIPFFNGYRPQFYFRTTDVTGSIHLPSGIDMCMPGDSAVMEVELIVPIAIEEGQNFVIREDGCTVGSGVVTEIVQ